MHHRMFRISWRRLRRVGLPWFAVLGASLGYMGLQAYASASAAATQSACPNAALRNGPSAGLPDCRGFELVSPVEKNGLSAVSPDYPMQAAPNGGALAYLSFLSAFAGAQSASYPNAYVSRRSPDGWETTSVSPPTPDITPPGAFQVTYAFSEDLSQLVTQLPLEQLVNSATPGVVNLFHSTMGVGGYSWINAVRPPHVPPEGCPPFILELCFQLKANLAAFAGASADFHRVLFESAQSLVAGAPEGRENLYASDDEAGKWHVGLVGILPDGTIPTGGSTAGSGSSLFYSSHNLLVDKRVANAISQDGSRVIFQAASDEGKLPTETGQAGMTEVYDRIEGHETVELSAPTPGATPKFATPTKARFWNASADGKHVFFTSGAELTTGSYTGASEPTGEDLYEYDLETRTLKDLTVDTNLPTDEAEGAAVQGVLGTASNGSYVYFVAKGELVPGKGVDHADNLYMVHDGGSPVYITTLSENDGGDWTQTAAKLQSYVTPDARHLAFTSVNSLPTVNFPSGYHNVNETTGEAEREVYEYSAPTEAEEGEGLTGSVVCVSCDPSGASPIGPGLLGGSEQPGAEGPSDSSPFHAVRVVSDSGGRVFFSSKDPLTVANGNTQTKVYEYERAGIGSCETSTGCVSLLSSPSSLQEAVFLDADSTGNDVFLATSSQLTSSDQDRQRDVYDARVDGGFAAPQTEAPCRAGCQGFGGEPQPNVPVLSAAIGPSGNLAQPAATTTKTVRKTASEIKAERLRMALKDCRHKERGHRRRSCETIARKRYGTRAKAHRSSQGYRGAR